MERKRINIAIDGTSSSGKSTMAKALARYAGYTYIDTGAMYRAVTLYCMRHDLIHEGAVDVEALLPQFGGIKIAFRVNEQGVQETYLNGENVEKEIRGLEVSSNVSPVAAVAAVRHAMVARQQEMGRGKGVVMDGRDIGTTVLPDAEIKLYVSSSADVRAIRRYHEMREKGNKTVTMKEVMDNVLMRDHIDMTRDESPLRKAPDAYALDNTRLTIEEQAQWIINYFEAYFARESKA